jgi:hypothetical protein
MADAVASTQALRITRSLWKTARDARHEPEFLTSYFGSGSGIDESKRDASDEPTFITSCLATDPGCDEAKRMGRTDDSVRIAPWISRV